MGIPKDDLSRIMGHDRPIANDWEPPKPGTVAIPGKDPWEIPAEAKAATRGEDDATPQHIQAPFWNEIPWRARQLAITPPPYSTVLAAAALNVPLVTFTVPSEQIAIIKSIECTVLEPGGAPFILFNIFKNRILLPQTGANFNTNHPLSPTVALDVRGNENQVFLITGTNTSGALAFTAIVRVFGWLVAKRDFGIKEIFDTE